MQDLIDFLRALYPTLTPDPAGTCNESNNLLPNDYPILKESDQIIEELPRELILIANEIVRLEWSEVSETWMGGRVMAGSPQQFILNQIHMRNIQRSIKELRELFDLLSKSHIEYYLRIKIPENHCIQIMHDPKKNTLVYVLITVAQAINHPYGSRSEELAIAP